MQLEGIPPQSQSPKWNLDISDDQIGVIIERFI